MPRILIYQIFTRLYGNKKSANVPNGSLAQNGSAKLNDFTNSRLQRIARYGFTHVWYTGLLEHATQTDYTDYDIAHDHPAVVKGKAGSPYAVKDYYDIDPDLATDVSSRMQEFEALVERTHKAGLGFIMDFVPNHVARQYHSDAAPEGIKDLGADDNTALAFQPQNNFYYLPGQPFQSDLIDDEKKAPSPYREYPAKATGNDCFTHRPSRCDWYETVKLNYGVDYMCGRQAHFDPVPSTWLKMTDILLFWAGKGVDAFRCDMAEMVPAAFWSYATARVKEVYPDILFIGEVYNPHEYRNYIQAGFDYLYDKVGLYDTLRAVTLHQTAASDITRCWQAIDDIHEHMLHFLENHDEQRIASDFFAADPAKARPALVVSALMRSCPFMVYAGQEIGERGMDAEGFSGCDGRTTIFDYWNPASLAKLSSAEPEAHFTPEEKSLYDYYHRVLLLAKDNAAFNQGMFYDLQYANLHTTHGYDPHHQYAFIRKHDKEAYLIVANFDDSPRHVGVCIPAHAFTFLGLRPATCTATDLLGHPMQTICLRPDSPTYVEVPARDAVILKL